MLYVIIQLCCNDVFCVFVCLVNCIYLMLDELGFVILEMFYIDLVVCVDCGVCVIVCLVSVIVLNIWLDFEQLLFVEINVLYYLKWFVGVKLVLMLKLVLVILVVEVCVCWQLLMVVVVGFGFVVMYVVDELLVQQGVQVNVFEKLLIFYGLVCFGVVLDYQNIKWVM